MSGWGLIPAPEQKPSPGPQSAHRVTAYSPGVAQKPLSDCGPELSTHVLSKYTIRGRRSLPRERVVTCAWCNEKIPLKQATKSVRRGKRIFYCRDFSLCQRRMGFIAKEVI